MSVRELCDAYIARNEELSKGFAHPVALLVPVDAKIKKPLAMHRLGQYSTHEHCRRRFNKKKTIADLEAGDRLGMLLRHYLVVDCDDPESYAYFTDKFPELKLAPICKTNKGHHIYMFLTEEARKAGVRDGPIKHAGFRGDLKTETQAVDKGRPDGLPTAALILVPPSPGYSWLPGHSLLEREPIKPSPELIADLVACLKTGGLKKRKEGAAAKPKGKKTKNAQDAPDADPEPVARPTEPPLVWNIAGGAALRRGDGSLRLRSIEAADEADVEALFSKLRCGGEAAWTAGWERGSMVGRTLAYSGMCCICRKKQHDNQFQVLWNASGVRRLVSHAGKFGSCLRKGTVVPFQPRSLEDYQARMASVLDACAERVDAARLAPLSEQLGRMTGGLFPVEAAWYDRVADVLHARAGARFAAVRVEDGIGAAGQGVLGGDAGICVLRITRAPWSADPADFSEVPVPEKRAKKMRAMCG